MRTATTALLAALSVASLTGAAGAQNLPPGTPSPPAPGQVPHGLRGKFEAANITHDGRLTLDQARTGGMRMVARNFNTIDAGHNGYVTLPDIRRFMHARRAARRQSPGSSASPPQEHLPP